MFVQRFPTPQTLKQAGKRQWEKFLHARHLWRTESGPRRLELFAHATDFCGSAPTANAKSLLALSLVQMLFAIEQQLGLYCRRIEALFGRHPGHDLFSSLPGAGPKLAPRLLSEIGSRPDSLRGPAARPAVPGGNRPGDPPHRQSPDRPAALALPPAVGV